MQLSSTLLGNRLHDRHHGDGPPVHHQGDGHASVAAPNMSEPAFNAGGSVEYYSQTDTVHSMLKGSVMHGRDTLRGVPTKNSLRQAEMALRRDALRSVPARRNHIMVIVLSLIHI